MLIIMNFISILLARLVRSFKILIVLSMTVINGKMMSNFVRKRCQNSMLSELQVLLWLFPNFGQR